MFQVIEYRVHLLVVVDFGLCLRLCRQDLGFRVYCIVEFLIEKESGAVFLFVSFLVFVAEIMSRPLCGITTTKDVNLLQVDPHLHFEWKLGLPHDGRQSGNTEASRATPSQGLLLLLLGHDDP